MENGKNDLKRSSEPRVEFHQKTTTCKVDTEPPFVEIT